MKSKQAFTLIELLVVVLIIGILAAVALPQYQKAVEKSKAAQAITMLQSVYNAAKAYQLATGSWPESFDELSVEIPWTKHTPFTTDRDPAINRSNQEWNLHIYKSSAAHLIGICIGKLTGNFAGGGFCMFNDVGNRSTLSTDILYCIERFEQGIILSGRAGRYCQKIFHQTSVSSPASFRMFK